MSGFVQELYSKKVKKYYLDNLKTYCFQAKYLFKTNSINYTAILLARFLEQRTIIFHTLFFDY